VTFSIEVTMHMNGEEVTALHRPAAHVHVDAIERSNRTPG
jgi:hypothetical protein